MSFQAYIDTIKARTGKDPEEFRTLAEARGLLEPDVKAGQILSWLKDDFGLGRGHGMALIATFNAVTQPKVSRDERINRQFSGGRARWRATYDRLLSEFDRFGPGVSAAPTDSYISLLRRGKKFGILQVTADRLDIGIKLKGTAAAGRLEPAGSWHTMVTHRVRVSDPGQIDTDVLAWLRAAYEAA
jgi:hypothetical protein